MAYPAGGIYKICRVGALRGYLAAEDTNINAPTLPTRQALLLFCLSAASRLPTRRADDRMKSELDMYKEHNRALRPAPAYLPGMSSLTWPGHDAPTTLYLPICPAKASAPAPRPLTTRQY